VADPRQLKPGELVRTLNSTPLGQVLTDRRLRDHRARAGSRISDAEGKRLDLLRYAAWLATERHAASAEAKPLPKETSGLSERDRNAARMREQRKATRIVEIPRCEDPKRRKRLERDIFKWLRWYAPDPYGRHGFTDQMRDIIKSLVKAFEGGGDQAIAASRGEGKTTASEWVETYLALRGKSPCAILFEATGDLARASLEAIKERLAESERLLADYPEICAPIRALNHTPQAARTQLVSGYRHDNGERFEAEPAHYKWCGKEIVLPHVPGAPGRGAIIATRGLDAAVRGVKYGGQNIRPTAAIINDPETESIVANEDRWPLLEKRIESGIGGLGGQERELARVMLTTVQRRGTISDRYTNPRAKPSWKGRRYKFLVKPPERLDLWDEYVQLLHQDWINEADGQPTHLARALYAKHRSAMDAGALVANPGRTPGGQLSGLQFYFDFVARNGPEAAATELDNNPPEEAGPIESGITAHRVQRQVNGHARRAIPPGCTLLVRGIDCRKVALHWVVRALDLARLAIYTIDYGVHEVLGTKYGSDEGLDLAIRKAILARLEADRANPYDLPIDLTLVDAGWQTDAVYSACAEAGLGVLPVMGIGRSSGCVQANFSHVQRTTLDRRPGDGWFLSRRGGIWLVNADADRWKQWEHDRWMTAPDKPGCLSLFGTPGPAGGRLSDDEKSHHSYARHIVSEVLVEEPVKGVLKRYWKVKSDNNHWLDASYYCDVAANMKGFRLTPTTARPTAKIPTIKGSSSDPAAPRPSLQQLAELARKKGGQP
jgi:hypothetical protein